MISVLIPVKDGGDDLARCLDAIARAARRPRGRARRRRLGSSDGSVELARSRGRAGASRSRRRVRPRRDAQRGARGARGECWSSPARTRTPRATTGWRRSSRPWPRTRRRRRLRPPARPPPRRRRRRVYFLDFLYGPRPRARSAARGAGECRWRRRSSRTPTPRSAASWARFPFAEDMIMSEDQEWSRRVLLDGNGSSTTPTRPSATRTTTRSAPPSSASSTPACPRAAPTLGGEEATAVLRRRAIDYARGELGWLCADRQRALDPLRGRSTRHEVHRAAARRASRAPAGAPEAASLRARQLLEHDAMKAVILAGGLGTRLSEETGRGPSRWSRSAASRSSGTS